MGAYDFDRERYVDLRAQKSRFVTQTVPTSRRAQRRNGPTTTRAAGQGPPGVGPQNSPEKTRRATEQTLWRYAVTRPLLRAEDPAASRRRCRGWRRTSGAICWWARARTGWARRPTRHRIVRSKPLYERTPSRHPTSHRQLPLRAGVSSSASSQLASPRARSRRRQPVTGPRPPSGSSGRPSRKVSARSAAVTTRNASTTARSRVPRSELAERASEMSREGERAQGAQRKRARHAT